MGSYSHDYIMLFKPVIAGSGEILLMPLKKLVPCCERATGLGPENSL